MDLFVFTSRANSIDYSKISIGRFLLLLRIIIVALAIGLLHFGLIAHFVIGPAAKQDETMTTIGLVLALAMLVMHPIAGSFVQRRMAQNLPEEEDAARGQLLSAYQTGRIVSGAMLEGAGFFNVMIYGFLSGQVISLAMAGLLCFAILMKFPLRGTLEDWLDQMLRESRDTRSLDQGDH